MVSQKEKKKTQLQSAMFSNGLNFIIKNYKELERREIHTGYVLEIQEFIYWRAKKIDDIST